MNDTATLVQGSPEWLSARMGKVTASRVADVIAKTKSGYSASRDNYLAELVLERLTGQRQESYTNGAMQWGTDTEPLARIAYEAHHGVLVEEVGLVLHPTIPDAAASPDGLVDDGQIEIKCPQQATHLKTLRTGQPDGKYIIQMQFQMACTGRAWCDFVSYDPRFPDHLQLFVTRINRDPKRIAELETEVTQFLAEVAATVTELGHEPPGIF